MGNTAGVTKTQLEGQMHSSGVDRTIARKAATFAVEFSKGLEVLREGGRGGASSTSTAASTSTSQNKAPGPGAAASSAAGTAASSAPDSNPAKQLALRLKIAPDRAGLVGLSMLMEKTLALAEIASTAEQTACGKALEKLATGGGATLGQSSIGAALPAAVLVLETYDPKMKSMG
jgi:hypothetical protein